MKNTESRYTIQDPIKGSSNRLLKMKGVDVESEEHMTTEMKDPHLYLYDPILIVEVPFPSLKESFILENSVFIYKKYLFKCQNALFFMKKPYKNAKPPF